MSQDKIATALLDELWDAGFKLNGPECDKVDEIGRRIEAERAQLRAEVERLQSALDDARAGDGVAQLAAQRQPLTDEQIEQMWSAAFNDTSGASTVQLLAHAVERYHGITAHPTP